MKRLAKSAVIVMAALGSAGCAAALRGGDSDQEVHLHLTYFMARSAGFPEQEARAIAAANGHTDYHAETTSVGTERRAVAGLVNPLTFPWILGAGLSDVAFGDQSLERAVLSRAGDATKWSLSPLAHRLHFPATGVYAKTEPAFVRDPRSGEVYYNNREAVIVLEHAFRALEVHDPDRPRTLALLGIGLHTIQDSYKHRGFCAALGHAGAWPDADDISRDLGMALEIAEATLNSLRHARRLESGASTDGPADWRRAFERMYAKPLEAGESRRDRWVAWIRDAFGDEFGTWEATQERWRAEGGDEAFESALVLLRPIPLRERNER